jgi:hypothetical protein
MREPGISDERYYADAFFVQSDLTGLKALLEKRAADAAESMPSIGGS